MEEYKQIEPCKEIGPAPEPIKIVKFFRKNIILQFIRFCIINLKMIKVIWKSHK